MVVAYDPNPTLGRPFADCQAARSEVTRVSDLLEGLGWVPSLRVHRIPSKQKRDILLFTRSTPVLAMRAPRHFSAGNKPRYCNNLALGKARAPWFLGDPREDDHGYGSRRFGCRLAIQQKCQVSRGPPTNPSEDRPGPLSPP